MWAWLKSLVAWFLGGRRIIKQKITQLVPTPRPLTPPDPSPASGDRRPPPEPPRDRDSRVRAPRGHGPVDRATAAAVEEPDDDENLVVIGGPHGRCDSAGGFPRQ